MIPGVRYVACMKCKHCSAADVFPSIHCTLYTCAFQSRTVFCSYSGRMLDGQCLCHLITKNILSTKLAVCMDYCKRSQTENHRTYVCYKLVMGARWGPRTTQSTCNRMQGLAACYEGDLATMLRQHCCSAHEQHHPWHASSP